MSQFANYFSTISIVATSPLLTPLIKFLRIFKLVSRLKLINIYYGPFLEFILNLSGMMFQLGDDPQDTKFAKFDVSTRGKLTKFKIMSVSVERIWSKYMIYFLIIVVRMYQAKLRVYIKKRKEFSWIDQIVDRIADESRIIIFTMVVVDVFFYSMHCLCHMSLGIKQSRDSNISYVLSCISVIFIIGDVLLLFQSNKEMNLQKVMRKRRQDEVEEKNSRIRLRRLERLKCMPEDAAIKEEEAAREAEREGVQAEGNEGAQASDQPTKSAKKAKKTSSLAENSSQAAVNFFTEGIKTDKIGQGRYFNSISLVKLIAVEPFYVTLQLMPNIQIGTLFFIQLAYFAYFCKRAFYNRIFSSCGDVIQIFINELFILLFLTIGMVFQLAGGFNNIPTQTSSILQFVGIGCLLLSCLFGTFIIFFSVFIMVWKALKKRKAKKIRDEYNTVFAANNKKEPNAQEQTELPSAQAQRSVIEQSAPRDADNDISDDFPKPMGIRRPNIKSTELGTRNEVRPRELTKTASRIQPTIDIESRGSQKNREVEKKASEPLSDNTKKNGNVWLTKGIRRTEDNSLRAEHTRNAPEDQRIKKRRILAARRMLE